MGKTSDQIREEIAAKRDDAAHKIDRIEAKVQELPTLAKESVMETVDTSVAQAREKVQETVMQVKTKIDVPGQVTERPLATLGVAFVGGYLIGKLLGGDRHDSHGRYRTDWEQAQNRTQRSSSSSSEQMGITGGYTGGQYGSSSSDSQHIYRQSSGSGEGLKGTLRNAARSAGLEDTLSTLGTALVATLTDQFHRTLRETFPEFAQHIEEQGGLGSKSGSSGSGSDVNAGSPLAGGSGWGDNAGQSTASDITSGMSGSSSSGMATGSFDATETEFGRKSDFDTTGDSASGLNRG